MTIEDNIDQIRSRIKNVCIKTGRKAEDVRILLATKTVSPQQIEIAVKHGEKLTGENKVQEFALKNDALSGLDIEKHFIGHLQKNKIKEVLKYVSCIQSVDSLPLAEKIDEQLTRQGRSLDIFIQVNTSFEPSKYGVDPSDTLSLVKTIHQRFKTLHIRGLMTIGLLSDIPEETRQSYRLLRELKEEINNLALPGLHINELSMGMSGDLEIAIEEGATIVRIGTAIFGFRNYNP